MKPSDFESKGVPYCSNWRKSEYEFLALDYIRALSTTGDTWRIMSLDECLDAVGQESEFRLIKKIQDPKRLRRFMIIQKACSSLEGIKTVGGYWRIED